MNDTHDQHLTKLPHASLTKVQTETTVPLPILHNTALVNAIPFQFSYYFRLCSAPVYHNKVIRCFHNENKCCLGYRAAWKCNVVFTVNDWTLWNASVCAKIRKHNIDIWASGDWSFSFVLCWEWRWTAGNPLFQLVSHISVSTVWGLFFYRQAWSGVWHNENIDLFMYFRL